MSTNLNEAKMSSLKDKLEAQEINVAEVATEENLEDQAPKPKKSKATKSKK